VGKPRKRITPRGFSDPVRKVKGRTNPVKQMSPEDIHFDVCTAYDCYCGLEKEDERGA
jgi:hypothetical protein